jgi:hypothetical protein
MLIDESVNERKGNGPSGRQSVGPRSQRGEIALVVTLRNAEPESGRDTSRLERIACLETIITILIEKDEEIRQQLAQYQG